MAVPGHPSVLAAGGTNQLIRDGAVLVRHAADVIAELASRPPSPPAVQSRSGGRRCGAPGARRGGSGQHRDLAERSGLGASSLLARLTELELWAAGVRLPGALFLRHRL
jgi:DNA processing protein